VPEVRTGPPLTIGALLEQAAMALEGCVTAPPRREARSLWAAVAGVTAGSVWLHAEEQPSEGLAHHFLEAVQRRRNGMPFAYAAQRCGFRSLDLLIDQRALIPRPETEGIVDLVLSHRRDGVAADVGTGCGCIALSLAVEGRFDRVLAIERSRAAATLARENVQRVQPATPVVVVQGDFVEPLAGERCSVIVANPPYLSEAEYADLDDSVRAHEPHTALISGRDGLDATRALLAGARALLAPHGVLVLEIDERRSEQVRALASDMGWARTTIHEDLFGRPRFAVVLPVEHG
jgi:release factor glutamine methyltransferase